MSMQRLTGGGQQPTLRTVEEELDHQIKKSNLLEADRKTFFINAEETKRKNNDIIDQLKKENKELKKLRDDLLSNKRSGTPNGNKTNTSSMSWGGEIKDENYWRKKCDEAKHLSKQKKSKLLQLQDKLNEVVDTKSGGHEESQLMRNIRILENRLDKVMIKYNEAQSIRKTYEQIVKRLREERVGYDNQLAAIERSLKGKEHDFEELLLLAHDATHAKELAQAELKKYEHKKAAVKELRKTYLEEKKRQIEQREDIISRMEKKEFMSTDKDDEKLIENSPLKNSMIPENLNNNDVNINKQKLLDYQEAFRKLYEATGVTDVNEIIQKYTTQAETSKSLEELKSEYQAKISYLTSEKQQLKLELNDLKYDKENSLTRKLIDDMETNVNNASNRCEKTKFRFERVQKILVDVKAGIEHVAEKLEFFKLENKPNIVVTDETLVEGLAQSVEKMKIIFDVVKNDANFQPFDVKHDEKRGAVSFVPFNIALYDKGIKQILRLQDAKYEGISKNNRVRLPDKDEEDVSDGEIDDDIDQEVTQKLKEKYEKEAKNEKNLKKKAKKK